VTACVNGDNCCPGGGSGTCNSLNDSDCTPVCGNGVVEAGEQCDGNCPSSCPNIGCTARTLQGTGCQRQCVASGTVACGTNGDGCCPTTGCNANKDNDCSPVCGNGVIEPGELCELSSGDAGAPQAPDGGVGTICPTICPNIGCTLRVIQGSGCQAQCVNAPGGADGGGTITGCINNDSCCPSGCNALNDNNCSPVCGNGVIEPTETCDGNCPTATTCISDQDNIRTFDPDSAAGCDEKCTVVPRPCDLTKPDGFCPSMCNNNNDADCLPPDNDRCANAMDISAGGTFPVNILASTKQDLVAACSAQGPEVYYFISLPASDGPELVYFSVLDNPISGGIVPLAIELYADSCPVDSGAAVACDDGKAGGQACRRNNFPLITSSQTGVLAGKPLDPTHKYFVAVRSYDPMFPTGSWTLTFHHVPLQCAQQGELVPPPTGIAFAQGNTCGGHIDNTKPSCMPQQLDDDNWAIYKCPSQSLHVSTCDGRTTIDTTLSTIMGSMTVDTKGVCTPTTGKEVACNADALAACNVNPKFSDLTIGDVAPGLVAVSVEGILLSTGGPCGGYSLGSEYKPMAGRP
jgi:hypothetical protein